jgi:hypothetical protein
MPVKRPVKNLLWLSVAVFAVACSASTSAPTGATPTPTEDAGGDAPINTENMELVKGLDITEIAVFQGPKVSLEKAGVRTTTRRAPVVAGRAGILRVYVKPADDWAEREVVATLELNSGGGPQTLTVKKTIVGPSVDDNLDSTINFELPLDLIAIDSSFAVSLKTEKGQPSAAGSDLAQYPADGSLESLGAKGTGQQLEVMIVPIKYNADGSGRLPDTSEAQLELYRQGFQRLYPAREVRISVRAPYSWSSAINRDGSGFDGLLNAVIRLRQSDGAPKGTYYFGAFAAGTSFMNWCGYGCVAGLSPLAYSATDTWSAASIGVGWSGENSVGTAVHEVGHGHGRSHAPCAPGGSIQGVDSSYPYTGAALGVWALDVVSGTLIAPSKAKDFMGYCDPTFVSDYTFGALATRMKEVYGAAFEIPGPPQTWRMITVRADGSLEAGDEVVTSRPAFGEARNINLALTNGKKGTVSGAYYPWDHLPGGLLVVPVGAPIQSLEVRDLLPGVVSKLTLTK